jgi:SAM-dependent methyltransferase
MSADLHAPLSSRLRRNLVSQFHRPAGILGQLVGLVLANRKSNVVRSSWTLELLDIQPDDRVLELGFGPGVAIAAASSLAPSGLVVGIDHSETMLRMASRRNAGAIRAGRVQLLEASLEQLPSFEDPFDKVFAVNALQFASDPLHTLRAVRGGMRRGGMIAIAQQSRAPSATDADSIRSAEQVGELLGKVGFGLTRIETLSLRPVCAACVLATAL